MTTTFLKHIEKSDYLNETTSYTNMCSGIKKTRYIIYDPKILSHDQVYDLFQSLCPKNVYLLMKYKGVNKIELLFAYILDKEIYVEIFIINKNNL